MNARRNGAERESAAEKRLEVLKRILSGDMSVRRASDYAASKGVKGMDRTSIYKWLKRYAAENEEGLKDRPPVPQKYLGTQSSKLEELILEKSLKNPDWGCVRLSRWLREQNLRWKLRLTDESSFSPPTVQKILNRNELGTRFDRVLGLEQYCFENHLRPEDRYATLIDRVNPCFCERFVEVRRPGEVILLDLLRSTRVKGIGARVTPFVAVDAFSAHASGELYVQRNATFFAAKVLMEKVLPLYDRMKVKVERILVGDELNAQEVRSAVVNRHEKFLNVKVEKISFENMGREFGGVMRRFDHNAFAGFLRHLYKIEVEKFSALQSQFAAWLKDYNEQEHFCIRHYEKSCRRILRGA